MRWLGGERGQTSAEYVGMLLVVAAAMAVVLQSGIGDAVRAQVDQAICAIATDAGSEDCAGGAVAESDRAPVRPAPNLYAADTLPLAMRSIEGTGAVPTAPAAEAAPEEAEEGALEKAIAFADELSGAKAQRESLRALLEGDLSDFEEAITHPLAHLRAGRSIPFVSRGPLIDELSGLNDARQAIVSLSEGDIAPGLLHAAFAVPIAGKFLKGGKYASQALARLARTGPGRGLTRRGREL